MAKWLQTRPTLMLVHEPTQGVDVGAREAIFACSATAAGEGMSSSCARPDHDELAPSATGSSSSGGPHQRRAGRPRHRGDDAADDDGASGRDGRCVA